MKFQWPRVETPNEFHDQGIENPSLRTLRDDNQWELQFEKQYAARTCLARYQLCDLVRQAQVQNTENEHCNAITMP